MNKNINITGKNGLNNFFDMISEINDDEIKNDPKIPELVQELIKDLPPELTKKEAKKITEEERIKRNEKISQFRDELYDKYSPEDGTYRIFYKVKKEIGEPLKNYEFMKEGAVRSTAWEIAMKICKSRYIRTKKELREIKEIQENFRKDFAKIFKEEYVKSMQNN